MLRILTITELTFWSIFAVEYAAECISVLHSTKNPCVMDSWFDTITKSLKKMEGTGIV